MSLLGMAIRGATRVGASVTLDNINLSLEHGEVYPRSVGPRGGSIDLTGGRSATYEMLYETQPWVRAAVDRLMFGIGRLPLQAFKDARQAEAREKQRTGPLAELLAEPFEGATPSEWKQSIVWNLLVHANAILVKRRPDVGRPPDELLPSSWRQWRIQLAPAGSGRKVDWYIFSDGPVTIPFRPEEILHIHPWAGTRAVATSKFEALRQTLKLEDAVQRAVIDAFENGVRPVGAYSVDGQLKPETAIRLRAQLNEMYGGPENFYKIMLLEGGAKWQPMTTDFVDAEMTKLRTLNREEVAAVIGIPQPSIGILDRATFSNVVEQHLMEYQDAYQPWTTLIEEALQVGLVKDEPTMRGQYVEFNYKEVLRGDPQKETDTLVKAVGGPYMTVDEARATQNLPPMRTKASTAVMTPTYQNTGGLSALEDGPR